MINKEQLDELIKIQTANGDSIRSVALHVSREVFNFGVESGLFKPTKSKKKKFKHCDATYDGVRVFVR